MSFDENIAALIQRIPKIVDHLQTEEATKKCPGYALHCRTWL